MAFGTHIANQNPKVLENALASQENEPNKGAAKIARAQVDFDNVAELKLSKLPAGKLAKTKGYYSLNGVGAALYIIKTTAEATADGDVYSATTKGNMLLDNGNVAVVQPVNDIMNMSKFGCIGDQASDDNLSVQEFIAYIKAKKIKATGKGNFLITETIDLRDYESFFEGSGQLLCVFWMVTANTPIIKLGGSVFGTNGGQGVGVSGIGARYVTKQIAANVAAVCFQFFNAAFSTFTKLKADDGAYGFQSPNSPSDNTLFSCTLGDWKARGMSVGYFDMEVGTATGGTGNNVYNWYASGDRSDVTNATCETIYNFSRHSDGAVNQINAEWIKCTRALVLNRASPRISGFHMEGLAANANNGAFILGLSATSDITMRTKTCNFSGGDPETNEVGSIANFALFQLEDVTDFNGSKIIVTGTNDNCTAATTNTRFAISNGAYDNEQFLDVPFWDDEDGIFEDGNGKPTVAFVPVPTTSHMPILRQYNNIIFKPASRSVNTLGTAGAGNVLWTVADNDNAMYNATNGKFTAPANGTYSLSFSLETADSCEIRVYNDSGVERTAYRAIYGSTGTFTNGSLAIELTKGEQVSVYGNGATTANIKSFVSFAKV
jgi:hypothetical protein